MIKVKRQRKSRLCQGDIIRDVDFLEAVKTEGGEIEVSYIRYPLAIVLTQDCDLMQDYRVRWAKHRLSDQDKAIVSALVAPLYNAEHFFEGQHLSELGYAMQKIKRGRTPGKKILSNQDPRYHVLVFPDDVPLVASVIDFKHYFSVNVEDLKERKRSNFVCQVSDLYREDVCQRFAAFLARIGLPES